MFACANVHSILHNDFKSEIAIFLLWIRHITIGPQQVKCYYHFTRVTLRTFEMLKRFFSILLLALFFPQFKSISIEKIAIFRQGISTIQIRTHLVKYYQYFTRVTHSDVCTNVPLFYMFAIDIVTYVIQIYFKWQTCYIHPGNKDHINRNSIV
jgi:hypothetical protein